MPTLRLRIVGARCSTCIIPIRKALEKAHGVRSVGANYVADLVLVNYDKKIIDGSGIVALIRKVGHEAVAVAVPIL